MKARPIKIEGDVAIITLTRGYEVIIDADDVSLVAGRNWCAKVAKGKSIYAQRADRSGGKWRTVLMHRILMGEPDGFDVDHIDGNGMNNRRKNLRLATSSQNACNRRTLLGKASLYKGVVWHMGESKWHARIKMHGVSRHLGLFDTQEAAHAAYCDASTQIHGQYGRTT